MLYVFHGNNTQESQKKALSLITSLRAKRADASYVRVEAGQWSPTIIEEHLGGQGLFSSKYIIFLDRLSENTEAKESIVDFIPAMNESDNIFIMLEAKLTAEYKKSVDASAEKVVESSLDEKVSLSKKSEFNIFALADAVGDRSAFKAWSLYRQAIDSGIEPENILGTLFWQLKSMILASNAKSTADAGLSLFVFSKAKKASGNYSAEELSLFTRSLITIYHDSHRGRVDAEIGIEKVLLGL